ncbi:unnamed protein product [Rotaria socialis]|uniref:Peptidase M12A domain-containing protein n=2 Tax=Rotaria socialis TaxID=392032 RepID=A0A817Z258_9BILA|nr:unnamed protein product [Rotaria socialis]CAF4187586.1 unnamed protein product [Rotaria socialis]CAF4346573.1 unnamed protein product [Rotaria socialis]
MWMCNNRQSRIGGNFECDIFLTPTTVVRGIGKKDPSACWPNGIVPYEVSSDYDAYDRAKIISAMRSLERVVSLNPTTASYCIRFRPKTIDDKYFISIKHVGRIFEGGQQLTLQIKSYCVDREATIMHEFMHAFDF